MGDNNKLCGILGLARRAGKIVFGTEACLQGVKRKNIKLLIVAKDAAERTKTKFSQLCKENNIQLLEILNIEEISKSIGSANKAIIGIKDINFSKEIIKIIDGGEIIG